MVPVRLEKLLNVDILWAKSQNLKLSNDSDVVVVNNARAAAGLAPIKIRMVHDYSGLGLNRAQLKVRFDQLLNCLSLVLCSLTINVPRRSS